MKRQLKTLIHRLVRDRRGNISIIAAMSMPVLVGFMGLGAEAASWYNGKRTLQNAADSAAIAAATNGDASTYDDEAKAVAARYGFTDGEDGITVTASNTAPCPGGSNDCYSVTITRLQPMILAQVTGYQGDGTVNGSPAKLISAKAVATQTLGPRPYCVLALAGTGHAEAIRSNGAPFADLTGCGVMSNSNATCNGHNLKADYGDAHGVNNGCGKKQQSKVPTVADPYTGFASKIPTYSCSDYWVAPEKKKDPPLPSTNILHGLESRSVIQMCGDVELSGPTFINSTGAGTVLVIKNGKLDLKGYKLQTQEGSHLTIIFTGSDSSRKHAPVGNGEFDIEAPTTGNWKGVAMYQDPSMSSGSGVDIDEAGNSPAWNITGLVYLPKASVTFSGAVNKSSNGASCFGLVIDNLRVNGTGSILAHGECNRAGLTLPYSEVKARGELVS